MHNIKLIHVSDMHLGSIFGGLTYDKAELRGKEAVYTCTKLIEDARDSDVLLLPGDIFDSEDVPISVIDTFLSAIESLGDVPVFYACGNHDYYYSSSVKYCVANSPSNLHIFAPDKISCITIEDKKIKIYGVSFASSHCTESLFDSMPKCDEEYINILCMHTDTSPGEYNYLNISSLAQSGLDYAALGHIHTFGGIKKSGNCTYAYSGIPEGRGFDECGPKGYIRGYISKKSSKLEFCTASRRTYIDEKLDISDFKNEHELIDVLNDLSSNNDSICRFTLVGENNFSHPVNINFVTNQCKAYYVTCIDNTSLAIFPEEYVDYSGLKGLCAQETEQLIANTDNPAEKEKYKKAFSLIINLFENR